MENQTPFAGWAILELMGHRRLAGYVQEVELAGHGMLRLDVPEFASASCDCDSADGLLHDETCPTVQTGIPEDVHATQFYSPSSVYCLTPTTEQTARQVAQLAKPKPVQEWEIRRALPVGADDDSDEEADFS